MRIMNQPPLQPGEPPRDETKWFYFLGQDGTEFLPELPSDEFWSDLSFVWKTIVPVGKSIPEEENGIRVVGFLYRRLRPAVAPSEAPPLWLPSWYCPKCIKCWPERDNHPGCEGEAPQMREIEFVASKVAVAVMAAPHGVGADIATLVCADIEARAQLGQKKYGERLLPNNGRDALTDAYQEALDLAMYLRQAIEESARKASQ
jgi:hypothetical protein